MNLKILLAPAFLVCCAKQPHLCEGLSVQMNYNKQCAKVDRAVGEPDCPGQRQYEITAYNGDQFYKINWFTDTLRAGSYVGSFWYTFEGRSYSLYSLRINIASYTNNRVRGFFYGDIVKGDFDLKLIEL